jgi:hypothetical protein
MANLLTGAKAPAHRANDRCSDSRAAGELAPRLRMGDGLNTKTRRAGFAGPRVAADASALLTYDSNFFQNLRTRLAASDRRLLRSFSVRGHRSEIMFGVLVIVLCRDRVADLGFSAGERQVPLVVSSRVLRAYRLGAGGTRCPPLRAGSK